MLWRHDVAGRWNVHINNNNAAVLKSLNHRVLTAIERVEEDKLWPIRNRHHLWTRCKKVLGLQFVSFPLTLASKFATIKGNCKHQTPLPVPLGEILWLGLYPPSSVPQKYVQLCRRSSFDRLYWAHYVKTCRRPRNRKYITYCNAARRKPSHGNIIEYLVKFGRLVVDTQGGPKKWCHKFMAIIVWNLNRFSIFLLEDSLVNLQ